MSKKTTVKSAPKSPTMTDTVKAIRVETGIKAGNTPKEIHGGTRISSLLGG